MRRGGVRTKAAFVVEPQRVEIREIPEPQVGPKDVLLKVHAAGICGSDLHLYRGQHAFRKLPAILGHEMAGEVVSVGAEVHRIKVGMAATVLPQIGCGRCQACAAGYPNVCPNKTVPGTPAWQGTFADYFMAPEETVFPLPEGLGFVEGALAEPLAVAVHVTRRLELERGQSLAILGSGTIGLLILSVAKYLGADPIVSTDALEYNLQVARQLGASVTVNVLKDNVEQAAGELTNGWGMHAAVIATGAPNIIDQATAITARRGKICLVGMMSKPIPVQTYNFVAKEITLVGSQTYTADDFEKAVELLAEGAINTNELITKVVPFAATAQAMETLDQRKENAVKIIVKM
ncbi:MAG TPA: alcohol dehydrogenase catalytic domain-containing protein [Firmicutes bacterium]|nr:alcohol dehydrogenase catalytic domain-containing protein [Bacillota bacterium]